MRKRIVEINKTFERWITSIKTFKNHTSGKHILEIKLFDADNEFHYMNYLWHEKKLFVSGLYGNEIYVFNKINNIKEAININLDEICADCYVEKNIEDPESGDWFFPLSVYYSFIGLKTAYRKIHASCEDVFSLTSCK